MAYAVRNVQGEGFSMAEQRQTIAVPAISLEPLMAILDRYRDEEGALVPVLQETQEAYGYLPRPAIQAIAKALHLSPAQVYAVATFYAQFRTMPRGRHIVRICRGTACHVRGAAALQGVVERALGVEDGGTTEDLLFSFETVACIGACSLAPTMMIDDITYGGLTPRKIQRILAEWRERGQ